MIIYKGPMYDSKRQLEQPNTQTTTTTTHRTTQHNNQTTNGYHKWTTDGATRMRGGEGMNDSMSPYDNEGGLEMQHVSSPRYVFIYIFFSYLLMIIYKVPYIQQQMTTWTPKHSYNHDYHTSNNDWLPGM